MEARRPPPDMEVEETFNAFVEDFGGELVGKHFIGSGNAPKNADYFLDGRAVVAELKCLEKDYFSNRQVAEKLNRMMNRWAREGLLRPEHVEDGRFRTDDLPRECGLEVYKLFYGPVKEAVEKANKQIKETKKYFNLPDAKGLLILANDGNYSLSPKLSMQILGWLLPNRYTGIDSFIYFTPNMRLAAPQYDRQVHVWISGPSRPSANAVGPEYLRQICKGWTSFLERRTGEEVTEFVADDHDVIDTMRLLR